MPTHLRQADTNRVNGHDHRFPIHGRVSRHDGHYSWVARQRPTVDTPPPVIAPVDTPPPVADTPPPVTAPVDPPPPATDTPPTVTAPVYTPPPVADTPPTVTTPVYTPPPVTYTPPPVYIPPPVYTPPPVTAPVNQVPKMDAASATLAFFILAGLITIGRERREKKSDS